VVHRYHVQWSRVHYVPERAIDLLGTLLSGRNSLQYSQSSLKARQSDDPEESAHLLRQDRVEQPNGQPNDP
jgi:hypothetical protein